MQFSRTFRLTALAVMCFSGAVQASGTAEPISFDEAVKAYEAEQYDKAFRGFLYYAEIGLGSSQYNVGVMYDNEIGVIEDDKQAFYWYQKAAEQGIAQAQVNLGAMYANGLGVKKDLKKAKSLFKQACDVGHNDGCKGYKILSK